MRIRKLYLVFIILLASTSAFAEGMKSKVKCYEAPGKMILKKDGERFFYVNHMASSQKSLKVLNTDFLKGKYANLKEYTATVKFSVVKDCHFQCDINLIEVKTLPPWEKLPAIDQTPECKN